MLKSNIYVFFCDVISLLAKKIEIFILLSFCDMTVPSKSNVPSL